MELKDVSRHYLRTGLGTEAVTYATLEEAKNALDNLLQIQSRDAISVIQAPNGRWLVNQNSLGILTTWVEDHHGKIVRLRD